MFSDDLVLHVTNQTNLYTVRHSKGNLNILEDEIWNFVAVLLLSVYFKVQYRNLYWSDAPDTHNEAVSCVMTKTDFERYYQTFIWLTTLRLHEIDTTKHECYLRSWNSISNCVVHLSIATLMNTLSLTIENTTQNNLLEEGPLGLGLKFGASLHLKNISFMQNYIAEQVLICQILHSHC